MDCKTNEHAKQVGVRFGDRDDDLAVAIPALASVRKQSVSVVVKSLLREALQSVSDLPADIKSLVA